MEEQPIQPADFFKAAAILTGIAVVLTYAVGYFFG